MDNKVYELLLKMNVDIQTEFKTLQQQNNEFNNRIEVLQEQVIQGFKETQHKVENRNNEKTLMIDFIQSKINELELKYYELNKKIQN